MVLIDDVRTTKASATECLVLSGYNKCLRGTVEAGARQSKKVSGAGSPQPLLPGGQLTPGAEHRGCRLHPQPGLASGASHEPNKAMHSVLEAADAGCWALYKGLRWRVCVCERTSFPTEEV